MNTRYHGIYTSSKSGKKLSTKAKDDLLFPPNIIFNGETYIHTDTFQVSTPNQEKNYAERIATICSDVEVDF